MRSHNFVVGLAMAIALAGCTTAGAGGIDKAGGAIQPVTLTAWSSEAQSRPSGAQLASFVAAVSRLSEGQITVQPSYGKPGHGKDPDQSVIEAVQGGQYSIGLAASRAFSSVGMSSFRALTMPFLIDSNAAAAAVVSDKNVTTSMLAGLESGHLTGLTLLPETLRHPFGTYAPVLGPGDYKDKPLRSLQSQETYAVFRSLGAKPGFWDGDEMSNKIANGDLPIVESSFTIASELGIGPSIGTGNVTFFPRTNVLFASAAAVNALTPAQAELLRTAAAQARDEAIHSITGDAEAARKFCETGGQVVLATKDQLAALRAKVAPYADELERDSATKAVIAAIRTAVAAAGDPDPVQACGGKVTAPNGVLEPWPVTTNATAIDGVYRVEIDDASLEAVGTPKDAIPQLHGTFTWTLDHGKFSFDRTAPNKLDQVHEWWYLVLRGDKAMLIDNAPSNQRTSANVLWGANWSVDGQGNLRFTNYVAGAAAAPFDKVWWFGKPFTRLR